MGNIEEANAADKKETKKDIVSQKSQIIYLLPRLATIQNRFPLLIHEIHLNEGHSAVITYLTCNLVNFELPNRFH